MPALDVHGYEPAAGPKGRSQWSGIGKLISLCLVGVLALTLVIAFLTTESRPNVWGGLFVHKTLGKNGIHFADVTLGMALSAVETVHPDLVLSRIANGKTAGTFRADGATHTLWFAGPKRGHKVFRMRVERTYEHLGEYQILARFGRRHGNPVTTDCGRRVFAQGRQCHYQWLTKGGVALDVYSRVLKDGNGARRTVLTVVAVDSYLEGKVRENGRVRLHADHMR